MKSIRVLLVGNYISDEQQSMLRFARAMEEGLRRVGADVKVTYPRSAFGRVRVGRGRGKWLRYIDKYVVFPRQLRREILMEGKLAKNSGKKLVIHVCDHSNSMYVEVGRSLGIPVVVTCHDLGAVRGALGEATGCPATRAGRMLQRWIAKGLGLADVVICVSTATRGDVERLVRTPDGVVPRTQTILLGQNAPYSTIGPQETTLRLVRVKEADVGARPFILNVGSSLPRKNRDGVLRIFARVKDEWPGNLVFAGERLSSGSAELVRVLGLKDRVIQIENPSDDTLEALYNRAFALLFPSKFEGFGWPLIEAQACGCPVLCSASGSLAEVAGASAYVQPWEAEERFSAEILRLANDEEARQHWIRLGFQNTLRFTTDRMISEYVEVYRSLASMSEGSTFHTAVAETLI